MVNQYGERSGRGLFFVLYLIIALYLVNLGLGFFPFPENLVFLDKWVLLLGAILIFFSGFKYLKPKYGAGF